MRKKRLRRIAGIGNRAIGSRFGAARYGGHNSPMTHVSPPAVTDPTSSANFPEEAFTAREERLRTLMVRAQTGDEAAYRVLLTELSEHLRGYFRRRLTTMAGDAEDLVQETLLAIHNQRHTYDRSRPLTTWFYAIARYKLVDFLRRHGRREGLTDPIDDDFSQKLSGDEPDATDARRDLQQLLEALPERQRQSVVYVKIEGRSVAETATLTGMSESAIKVNVHRALKALAAKVRGSK
jgi:RNA polymerase sigma-70 factor (ECF subfamily)